MTLLMADCNDIIDDPAGQREESDVADLPDQGSSSSAGVQVRILMFKSITWANIKDLELVSRVGIVADR